MTFSNGLEPQPGEDADTSAKKCAQMAFNAYSGLPTAAIISPNLAPQSGDDADDSIKKITALFIAAYP